MTEGTRGKRSRESEALSSDRSTTWAGRLLASLIRMTAVGVPVLYVFGRGYADGYWQSLGLSSSLMASGVDVYLYLGFFSVVAGSANLLGLAGSNTMLLVLVGGLVLTVLTSLIAAIDQWATSSFRGRIKVVEERTAQWRAKHHGWLKTIGYPAVVIGAGFYALFFSVLTLLLVVLFALVLAEKAGSKTAENQFKRYSEYAASPVGKPLIATARYHLEGQPSAQGLLLSCSDKWCVVYESGRFAAIPIDDVISIAVVPAQR